MVEPIVITEERSEKPKKLGRIEIDIFDDGEIDVDLYSIVKTGTCRGAPKKIYTDPVEFKKFIFDNVGELKLLLKNITRSMDLTDQELKLSYEQNQLSDAEFYEEK